MYIDILMKWNARINLTAIREPEEIVTRHFGESLFCASQIFSAEEARDMIDLGSGAGFPGIPFALWSPETQVTLIEAQQKKATFLRAVIFALELKNVKVFSGRAEMFPGKTGLVTMRAVERFEESFPLAVNLTEEGGRLGLLIGAAQVGKAHELGDKVKWNDPVAIPGSQSRVLLPGVKTSLK